MTFEIRTIEYEWADDKERHIDDVVVGDGTVIFDENFEYDHRIFFYFQDEEEFQNYFTPGNEFTILRVED